MLCGGFPELIGKADKAFIKQYLRHSLIEKIVFSDIPVIYPIESPQLLVTILEILIENPGMILDFNSLSQELGIARQTLSKYFEYLEMAHLVVKLYNFSRNMITSEKRLKKFYPAFLSIAIAPDDGEAYRGKLVEALCCIQSGAKFFWRDKQKNEVDIVSQKDGKLLPIEVKFKDSHLDTKGLVRFCRKYNCKRALMLTRSRHKHSEDFATIEFMPVWEYLLKFT
jgi:predicted AAA+ superfamily ATPase